jgi:hypothetical protein
MKSFFLTLIIGGNCFFAPGQDRDCKSLHHGVSKLISKTSGITIITRTKDIQIEENEGLGFKIIYSVIWVDDCTFELRPLELVKGEKKYFGETSDIITVKIIERKRNSYLVRTTVNYTDMVLEREILILK